MTIHPTAIIENGAEIHESASIGPYSIVEAGAVVGPDCVIESQVRIYGGTRMGRGNRVSHGATLGSAPQDLSYRPDKAKPLTIGDFNQFRECANISQGIKTDQGTRIGSHNYFMAFSHVGHDCQVGDHNILANSATLAGHVALEHHIFLSGQVAVHQFCRIGAYAMGQPWPGQHGSARPGGQAGDPGLPFCPAFVGTGAPALFHPGRSGPGAP